jgi:hypothetical protein
MTATTSAAPELIGVGSPLVDLLLAVDEFHHVSANPDNRLGAQLAELITRDKAHIVAMTGSYFRGDAVPVLTPEDEVKFLAEVSSSIQRLQRAGIATKRSLESAKQCAPHLVEKNSNLIDIGLKVLKNLDKARSLIAELQLKRSRILGALTSSLQKKLASQLAEAAGQKSDALITQMNASLAELNLRTEIEQWWFTEGIEKGPARGFLAGPQENGLKASEILRLAIASCDVFIARAKEAHSSPAFNEKMKEKAAHSALEISLYQRREALGRWLEQANRSSTITAR